MLEVVIRDNQCVLTDILTDFCSIGWVRLATMLLQYFSTWSITALKV